MADYQIPQNSSVGIVMGYGRDGLVQFPAVERDFCIIHIFQTGSEAHSYPTGTRISFLVLKRLEREADHSPPSSAKVKSGGTIPPPPHMS
jgi:hypothetical protein